MSQDNPQAIIQVRDLCNRFGAQAVHEHLDLDVRRGEILGVVGGSGTGKSVLLRSIVGLRRPTSGSVRVFGEDLLQLPEERRSLVERRFGVLFQQGALFSSLTVVENVALPLIENAGLPRADAEHLAQVKLALAGLPANAGDKYPASLSGGMIKRAALARALALDPDILFLDEPTAGVDIELRRSMWSFLTELNQEGISIILTTHYLEEAEQLCRNIAIIDHGEIVQNTSMRDLLMTLHSETFLLDLKNVQALPPTLDGYPTRLVDDHTLEVQVEKSQGINDLFAQLGAQGIEVLSLRNKTNRLEELFVSLVEKNLTRIAR
mgnify:CR=1 FL=1